MYRLIVSDLDETLLPHSRQISRQDVEAIRSLRGRGVKFVPASGRGYASIDHCLRDLGLYDAPEEYAISFNGGAITENRDHRLLHLAAMDFDLVQELYRRGISCGVGIHVYTKEQVYAYGCTETELAFLSKWMDLTELHTESLDFLRDQQIVKCLYMKTDIPYLQSLEPDFTDLAPRLDISYSSDRYMEFNPRGVNKGQGLLRLAELLGVDPKDVIAVGDNWNDVSMLRAAGLGVAVANAPDEVKAVAGAVTEASCEQSAISEVIRRFVT